MYTCPITVTYSLPVIVDTDAVGAKLFDRTFSVEITTLSPTEILTTVDSVITVEARTPTSYTLAGNDVKTVTE